MQCSAVGGARSQRARVTGLERPNYPLGSKFSQPDGIMDVASCSFSAQANRQD